MNNRLPFLPTRGLVIFPKKVETIYVGREASLKTIEELEKNNIKEMIFSLQRSIEIDEPKLPEDVYGIGVKVKVLQIMRMNAETLKLFVEAEQRVAIENPRLEEEGFYTTGYVEDRKSTRLNSSH